MGYIEELRQAIGHRPVILAGAAVFIINPQGKLLLFRRIDNGCWGPPGGMMEPGESLEETARRETLEETGLEIKSLELFGVYSGPDLFYEYPNGDQVFNVTAAFVARDYEGEVQVNRLEGREWQFFDLLALPEPLSPPIKGIVHQFVEKKLREKT